MSDYASKFLKIAVGLGVLAAGVGVGYHFVFRDQKSEQIDQTEIKPLDDTSIIEISNIHKGIDSSGASILLKKSSESDYSGTILICEGGCSKFPAKANLQKNILILQYRINWEQFGKKIYESRSEKLDLSELRGDGIVHAEDNGYFPEGLLYDCRMAKKGIDSDRVVGSTYCYNHEDF